MENKEIEFKYKIDRLPDKYDYVIHIRQIYFDGAKRNKELSEIFPCVNLDEIHTFRAREIEASGRTRFIITLKTKAKGLVRNEYEEEVPKMVFDDIISDNIVSEIIKNRYILTIDSYKFEIDEYLNLRERLFTAEVEIEDESGSEAHKERIEETMSKHLGLAFTDVTFDNRYKNSNLRLYFG